jgi:hypothetical protein
MMDIWILPLNRRLNRRRGGHQPDYDLQRVERNHFEGLVNDSRINDSRISGAAGPGRYEEKAERFSRHHPNQIGLVRASMTR